tara:strand:- start:83 stop:454 length:372 start_codon:yes stop_codon:yes gene_type:complete
MLKRTISIGLVLSIAFAMAAPLIPHRDCNMSCCEAALATCCDKNMDLEKSKVYKTDMQSCNMGKVFVPVLSAPHHQFKMKLNIDVTHGIDVSRSFQSYKTIINKVLIFHPSEPPLAYNFPLLA